MAWIWEQLRDSRAENLSLIGVVGWNSFTIYYLISYSLQKLISKLRVKASDHVLPCF